MMNRKNVLAAALFAAMSVIMLASPGCGTQYGGKPSSIPRDVDSDDAAARTAQPPSSGSQNRSSTVPPPSNTGSPGTGTESTGGTGTRR